MREFGRWISEFLIRGLAPNADVGPNEPWALELRNLKPTPHGAVSPDRIVMPVDETVHGAIEIGGSGEDATQWPYPQVLPVMWAPQEPVDVTDAGGEYTTMPDRYPGDPTPDYDFDTITDEDEFTGGTNPRTPDTDEDGVPDGDEFIIGTDPLNPDTDEDGIPDGEELLIGTDPTEPDTDQDGYTDGYEIYVGTDPLDAESHPTEPEEPIPVVCSYGYIGSGPKFIVFEESINNTLLDNQVGIISQYALTAPLCLTPDPSGIYLWNNVGSSLWRYDQCFARGTSDEDRKLITASNPQIFMEDGFVYGDGYSGIFRMDATDPNSDNWTMEHVPELDGYRLDAIDLIGNKAYAYKSDDIYRFDYPTFSNSVKIWDLDYHTYGNIQISGQTVVFKSVEVSQEIVSTTISVLNRNSFTPESTIVLDSPYQEYPIYQYGAWHVIAYSDCILIWQWRDETIYISLLDTALNTIESGSFPCSVHKIGACIIPPFKDQPRRLVFYDE